MSSEENRESKDQRKRLFFGMEIHAPWPPQLPKGRYLDQEHRHLTLAFLGNILYEPLNALLMHFPKIRLSIGHTGYFDACIPLPEKHPRVIAWHAQWLEENNTIANVQNILSDWLISHGYSLDKRPWLPHVTLCREPFSPQEWIDAFTQLPFYTGALHLYESVGNLTYIPIWSYPIHAPFEEIKHVADIAFLIRGKNLEQLYYNAFTALAFKMPALTGFFKRVESFNHLDDVIIALNAIVTKADIEIGTPLKAVSFHGEVHQHKESILEWEMIVDV